jgi:hypothetical protein
MIGSHFIAAIFQINPLLRVLFSGNRETRSQDMLSASHCNNQSPLNYLKVQLVSIPTNEASAFSQREPTLNKIYEIHFVTRLNQLSGNYS